MKRLMIFVGAVLCAWHAALADAITLAPHESKVVSVDADGTVTQAGRVFVSTEAKLYKTGTGEWQVPESQIDQPQPLKITVQEGSLSIPKAGGTALPDTYDLPEDLKAKAAVWVDASDENAAHFAGTTGEKGEKYVDTWYDVRETSVDSPTRPYYALNRTYSTVAPQKVTTNGFKAIWFGGYGSGRSYHWMAANGGHYKPEGATPALHVFAVHGVIESYGHIFGSTNGSASTYVAHWDASSKAATLLSNYWWNSGWSDMVNGRTYVDGERIDGTHTRVRKGFHLLEANSGDVGVGYTTALYSKGSDKKFAGGDFLCEALVFNSVLSEPERRAVQDYLMHKWFGKGRPRIDVELAKDAAVKVGDGLEGNDLLGCGEAVKAGSADYVRPYAAGPLFDGTLDLNGGSARLSSPLAVKVRPGDRIISEQTLAGAEVAVASDAAADALVKDGNDTVTVSGIPADVKALDVRGGALVVRAPVSAEGSTSAVAIEVPVENHDFEDITDEEMPGGVRNLPTSGSFHGWTQISGNTTYVYDFNTWTTGVTGHADGASKAAWNMNVYPPPVGSKAMVVRSYGKCYTPVSIPVAGTYELSYQAMVRSSGPKVGDNVQITLTDGSGNKVASFGEMIKLSYTPQGFRAYSTRAFVPAAGNYRLQFEGMTAGTAFSFDDFRLRRVVEETGMTWQIPNGGFKKGTMSNAGAFSSANTAENWTFADPAGWTDPEGKGRPSVGVTLLSMDGKYRMGGYYNNSRGDRYDVEMLMRGKGGDAGAQATTTFTPSAGTWYLEATVSLFGSYAAGMVAQAIVGNVTNDLGTVTPTDKLMTVRRWPKPLTVTGTAPVTLRLTLDAGGDNDRGVISDDFTLTTTPPAAHSDIEYIRDGSFEEGGSSWIKILDPASTQQSGIFLARRYAEANWAFGWDPADGLLFTTLYGKGGVAQEVTLPEGRFRLSCMFKGRVALSETGYYPHPLDVFVAKGGVTNVIGRTLGGTSSLWSTNHVRQAFDFTVRDAGAYTVGFVGRGGYPANSESHVDCVSLREVTSQRDRTPPFAEDAVIRVASGALLSLDFDGTNRVGRIVLGGRGVSGDVSAKTHPEYIVGEGVLHADPSGMTIIVR